MKFWNKYRYLTVFCALLAFIVTFYVASRLIRDSLPQNLLVNVSAGALAIIVALGLVTYFDFKEKLFSTTEARSSASKRLYLASAFLLGPFVKIYDLKPSTTMAKDQCKEIIKALSEVDIDAQKLSSRLNYADDYQGAIYHASKNLYFVIQFFAFALSNELNGIILKILNNSEDIQLASIYANSRSDKVIQNLNNTLYFELLDDIEKLVNLTANI